MPSEAEITGGSLCPCNIYMSSRDLNSGSLVCATSTLTAELSPETLLHFEDYFSICLTEEVYSVSQKTMDTLGDLTCGIHDALYNTLHTACCSLKGITCVVCQFINFFHLEFLIHSHSDIVRWFERGQTTCLRPQNSLA